MSRHWGGSRPPKRWLTQAQTAKLFHTPRAIVQAPRSVYRGTELPPEATYKESYRFGPRRRQGTYPQPQNAML